MVSEPFVEALVGLELVVGGVGVSEKEHVTCNYVFVHA